MKRIEEEKNLLAKLASGVLVWSEMSVTTVVTGAFSVVSMDS